MADLTTLLSMFLKDLYSGSIGGSSQWSSLTLTKNALGVTSTAASTVRNTTAAAAGAQQISPGFDLVGQGWKTDATAASQEVRWRQEVLPVQGTSAPSSTWKLKTSVNAGAFTEILTASASAVTSGVAFAFSGGSTLDGITTANTIAQVNGTNAQTHYWYKSLSGANFTRASLFPSSNDWYFGQDAGDVGGTGTAGDIIILATSGKNASLRAGASRLNWTDTGGAQLVLPSAGAYTVATKAMINTAPTIASGFGTSPSIVASNGSAAFTVNVGTGGTASNGVITMPAATTGWIAHVENLTGVLGNYANQRTVQIASTTTSLTLENQTISTGAALAWTASDVLVVTCVAY